MGMFEHKFVKIYQIGQSSGLLYLAEEQFQFFFSNSCLGKQDNIQNKPMTKAKYKL